MTEKLTRAEVEQEVDCLCRVWTDCNASEPCTDPHPCPAHRLLDHIEAQDQEITDLRTLMRVLRGELENHREAYLA